MSADLKRKASIFQLNASNAIQAVSIYDTLGYEKRNHTYLAGIHLDNIFSPVIAFIVSCSSKPIVMTDKAVAIKFNDVLINVGKG